MNSKIVTYIAVIIAIAAVLSSAFIYASMQNQINDLQNKTPSPTQTPTPAPTSTSNPTAQPIVLVDDEGFVTTLDSVPQKVVCLAPSNTQIMFAIGAGSKVVGLTDYDDYPYNFSAWIEAGNMTSIGGYSTPNKEAIAQLNPDIILATPINDVDVVTLRDLGYKVLVVNPTSISGILQDISLVGRATGTEAGAAAAINGINKQIDEILNKINAANITQPPTVFYEVWDSPLITAGGTSWINDVLNKVGSVNIFENETQQYPVVSSESVAQLNPDVILLPSSMGSGQITPESVKANAGWSTINAVKNNKVVVIDGDLFSVAGPRIAENIAAVAQAIYPELFNSP